MLTEDQTRYLNTIPKEKTVAIKPHSQQLKDTADDIIKEVKQISPEINIQLLGAVGLGISGQGDLDMYMLHPASDFHLYLDKLVEHFGKPLHQHPDSVEWCFDKDGVEVELYLTDPNSKPMQEQLKIFNLLRENNDLKSEYEKLKSEANGKSFRDYQKAKYEFYNRLLSQ